jgi:hypothetical protein
MSLCPTRTSISLFGLYFDITTYSSDTYVYAYKPDVLCCILRLIINVLSFLSFAWLLESSRPDIIQTSALYLLRSIGQIATLTLHIYLVVLASSLADRSRCIQPVSLSGNQFPNDRLASGHPTLTQDITVRLCTMCKSRMKPHAARAAFAHPLYYLPAPALPESIPE